MTEISLQGQIKENAEGQRLDQALAELFSDYSRSRIQQWIKSGEVSVNDQIVNKIRAKVYGNELIKIQTELEAEVIWDAEDISIDIVHEDEDIIVVNKAAGLVVHPATGNWHGTLVNALLNHHADLEQLPRAGIVHRLDKDTTGLMVVAKTLKAHTHLVNELQLRNVNRQYICVVNGALTAGGMIDQPINRHPVKRKQMTVIEGGKPSITHYRIEQRFSYYTVLRVKLETGRTHQIRVHMSWFKHPLVGDPVYGGRLRQPPGVSSGFMKQIRNFNRQALHATKLGLIHPTSGEQMTWDADIPEDMKKLINVLEQEEQRL